MRFFRLILWGASLFGSVAGHADYLLSDLKVLRTKSSTLVAVYLAPNQYLTQENYRATPTGILLRDAAKELANPAGSFLVSQYEEFYTGNAKALGHIREVVAPAVLDGKILDGRSNLLLLFRDGKLVGILKAAWVTAQTPVFPFQVGAPGALPRWPELDSTPALAALAKGYVTRTESRELKHLAGDSTLPEDIVGTLAYFGSSFGVFGVRREAVREGKRFFVVNSEPNAFFVHTGLPELALYYRRRGGFEVVPELSSPEHGTVLTLPASRWNIDSPLSSSLPGRVSVKTLLSEGRLETFDKVALIRSLDHYKPSLATLLNQVRSGTFTAVTDDELCPERLAGFLIAPGFRGTIDP